MNTKKSLEIKADSDSASAGLDGDGCADITPFERKIAWVKKWAPRAFKFALWITVLALQGNNALIPKQNRKTKVMKQSARYRKLARQARRPHN